MTAKPDKPNPDADVEQPLISHLLELRNRLLRIVMVIGAIVSVMAFFANDLYALLAGPLTAHMPKGSSMIAIEVTSTFFAPFKLAMVLSVFIAVPYALHEIWAFVAPGLYKHERRMVVPLLVSSSLLFYLGMAFAYFVVFPVVFQFMAATAPAGVAMMTDINKYLDFVLTMFFAFGIAFEVPVATFILVWMGVTTPQKLTAMRPYVVLIAFVIGAILTPPDGITQTMLAIPMWLLFEVGVWCARLFAPVRHSGDVDDDIESEKAADRDAG
jgi:sec-independent protein translocase protein TatC